MTNEIRMTRWHLVAFLGELVLWGCAAWAGWTLVSGPARPLVAGALLVAIIVIWSVWAAPRTPRRLSLWPRLGLITGLGLGVGALFLSVPHWPGITIVLAATLAILVAQYMDERSQGES